jgi:hypothetical protein
MAQQTAQQQSQAQQMMLNQQNNMAGQGPRPMPQQPNQQGFLHLAHQMQASPLPGQQPPQAPMGMPNQGLPQNMTQNQQQQFQVNLEQQRSQQNGPGRPLNGPPQLSPQDNALVQELTNRLIGQMSEEDKINLRNNLQQRLEPAALQRYQAQGVDPVLVYFRNQAITRLKNERARMQQQQLAMGQQPQNMPSAAPPMQPQRSVNPSPLTGQAQPPASMGGNPDFGSFMGNMENLAAQQQQQGVMAEQAGQMVVPASGAPRNATPQPGVMAGPPTNLNNQRNVANSNVQVQQQQQLLHAQQMQQQQRLQQSIQQQQSQAQARLNAQNKAQQMGLQGQPGGMGPGPVPPQQSPAMATLNAPMRTPSQQMNHPETSQINPTAKFGAPLDPRFMQGNQRPGGQGNGIGISGINPAVFNSMDPQQQQQLASLPQDKLHEVVSKWNEARAQNMAAQMQGGRPQMPMQGNPQVRPGQQMPQQGQFNPQNAANQFATQNAGQRAPPSMVNGMNPTQQMVLQQQMANMRPNPIQQRGMQMAQDPQQIALQMDNMMIPPALQNHGQMPPGIPAEIKKWGQLKQWTAQNAQNLGLPPNSLEAIKQLQGSHYRHILSMRSRQQAQGGNMQPGPQGPQAGNPAIGPGMGAPVAPMGPNPIQMQTGINMTMPGQVRPPTQQEIHNIRNHPSGKMASATDDQIRSFFMRNLQAQAQQAAQAQQQSQLTPQQQHQRQQMMQQMQMQQRIQQANAQQQSHQAGQPQPQHNAQPQAKPTPVAQPKQAPPAVEPTTTNSNAANTARAAKPQPNAKSQPQSSPPQPAKNLKRSSSSDDVVEVPNPNTQQARTAQPSTQASGQPSQMRVLTAAQLATLDPEQRKKYEHMLRMSQANQANMANRTMQVDPAMQEKLESIKKEERDNFRDSQQDIPMDEATRKFTAQRILQIVGPLTNVGKILSRWFQITSDEETARKYCRVVSVPSYLKTIANLS